MKQTETRVVLQYAEAGTPYGTYDRRTVHPDDAGLFVAIDRSSGGYPYSVPLAQAHNFVTEDKALAYAGTWASAFIVRAVTITYEYY